MYNNSTNWNFIFFKGKFSFLKSRKHKLVFNF